jgi:hypothetical protein
MIALNWAVLVREDTQTQAVLFSLPKHSEMEDSPDWPLVW